MSSRKLDGVHSLNALLEKGSQDLSHRPARSAKAKTTNDKIDVHADDSNEESSDSDSDSDAEPTENFIAKLNGHVSPKKAAGTPMKKTKRGKDDEVADSDVERKVAATKKKAPVHPESSSEDEDSSPEAEADSDSDSSDSDSEANNKPDQKNKKAEAASKQSTSTSTSTSDSDSDSESEAEETSKPAKKPAPKAASTRAVNGAKSAERVSTSSSESSSDDSDNEKQSPEEEDSSDEDESNEEANAPSAVANKRNSNQLNVPGFVGKNFQLRQAQGDEDGKDMADFFAKAKLEGKQLWYFTAPASVPINVIEKTEINMDKVKKGQPVLKYNSEDYTVSFDNDVDVSKSYQLLIPDKKGTRYGSASQKVDNVWHFKCVMQIGDPRVNERALEPNAPRPQPPNLRARFRPIGVTSDTPMGTIGADASSDDEDVDMTAAPAPSSSRKSKAASAQSQDAMDIDEPTPKSSKKDKKKSKTSRNAVQDSQSTVIEVPDSQPLVSKKEKKSKKRRDSIESISSVGSKTEKSQKGAATKASKRKHASEDDQDSASAQLEKESQSAEKKAKKAKTTAEVPSAKKETAILPPTFPKANYTFSGLGSPAPAASTPQSTKKSSKKPKETPIQPPSIRRESAVPVPHPGSAMKQASPATPASNEASKEKRKRRKSEKETPVPREFIKLEKEATPIPSPMATREAKNGLGKDKRKRIKSEKETPVPVPRHI
ncbi:hypothetical protein CkaCkLH20_08982 [Colletotrichum karsti]|uniref:DNA-directed RNA polymerase I subunit n=1 Tax=Colletotrichum karsti TaxID=1095194 RepID=A0A9P6LHF5_9PEZI|nr:uncharacterized protein CkaCkLH20_08982 [Colletotrichum karsti]KAF9873523.1 hypothetical protein CkaCkLH20_08982 [Colletotrichum karsti]